MIWQSRDLVNWAPVGPALHKNIGTVWAMDLVKHEGRYFIYIPVLQPQRMAVYVVACKTAAGMAGAAAAGWAAVKPG